MRFIKKRLRKLLQSKAFYRFCEKRGFHVTRNHFYSPLPDTKELQNNTDLWQKESALTGIELNVEEQLSLLEDVFSRFQKEYQFSVNQTPLPHEYNLNCGQFGLQPAAILHSMIRHLKPRTIIEVGSGSSTYVSARACEMNRKEEKPCRLMAVEPYPNAVLRQGFAGLSELIPKKVQELDSEFFEQLKANDILFIDSSHVAKIGSDVVFLYLEVLPRLKEGVYVHIHDIFFPMPQPREWVIDKHLVWNEQYLLQAFLCFNPFFKVVFANYYMNLKFPNKMTAAFPLPKGFEEFHYPSSFWIKKITV